ncbi:MAG: 16S rRNA (guanine(527)-N(7))-methyltransferase RsmG [Clostridiales bacterium]|nr:16S rRNA (guanine(527)-N(7))-methyltransferase RsmG [Clostridiales bacterium]
MNRADWEVRIEASLQALAIGYDERTAGRIARYHELLTEWNERMNLTGDTDFETSIDRHYMDSLAPLLVDGLFPISASVIDVGSGAGFPGLPLAIARPDLQVTLLDSLQKRIGFLSAVVEALELTNVSLVHARAEDGGRDANYREAFDIALARAVAPLPVLCELLLPFAKVGGKMICYKGPSADTELEAGQKAAQLVGGGEVNGIPIPIPSQPDWQHCVLLSEKIQETVRQYPRKAGTPSRKPLGGFDKAIK